MKSTLTRTLNTLLHGTLRGLLRAWVLVVPLVLDGALVGVFDIDSPVPGRFDVEDQEGLETIATLFVRSVGMNA